ncbi:MAG: PD40 domain-containing protein, partial [Bdellovibrionales bacterium]|nr:PD40 domain-containing protein [Bdellovibrionales bacterium]
MVIDLTFFRRGLVLSGVFSLLVGFTSDFALAQYNDIVRGNVSEDGVQSTGGASASPDITNAGDIVVFESEATNIVASDSNGFADIFLYDISGETPERISTTTSGGDLNGNSRNGVVAGDDSNLVAYETDADNAVAGDSNDSSDIILHDRSDSMSPNSRISVTSGGVQGDGDSTNPAISDDGAFVVFESVATNLVAGDSNSASDIFLRDVAMEETTRISVNTVGTQGNGASRNPSIDGDGNIVVFESDASNLVGGDGNESSDIFVRDIDAGTTELVSQNTAGSIGNADSSHPSVSADGTKVAFQSLADNLVSGSAAVSQIYVRDLTGETTVLVSQSSVGSSGNGDSIRPVISPNGRYVAFESSADNLVAGDINGASDIFVYDLTTEKLERVSVNGIGAQGDNDSLFPVISEDGHFVAFGSKASNLVAGDSNNLQDIFIQNIECLVTLPDDITFTDTDGDSTLNCDDECGLDSAKSEGGQCGCGVADTDSDSDGTADCSDGCPSDIEKVSAGSCGCG